MIIQQSSVSMSAEHSISETRHETTSISAIEFSKQVTAVKMETLHAQIEAVAVSSSAISESFMGNSSLAARLQLNGDGQYSVAPVDYMLGMDQLEQMQQQRMSLLQSLIDALVAAREAMGGGGETDVDVPAGSEVPSEGGQATAASLGNYQFDSSTSSWVAVTRTLNVTVNVQVAIEEYEYSGFQASGMVRTADGRTLDLNLELNLERSYSAVETSQRTQQLVFHDPLILNFDGSYAELTDEQYEFDLDMDGDMELISYLQQNSAMLALDKNKDGVINDGSELFGAATGDGFAELAEYDEDGNGYIDEADSIFSELRLWQKTMDGESLETLAERDVGAIYLGSAETPFMLKDEENNTHGRVRETGFYLAESGGVGSVQEIDMAV